MPRWSDDDVINFMVDETLVHRVRLADKEAQEEERASQWRGDKEARLKLPG